MSVYNTEPEYLSAAVESILHQTFADFEFLIADDCSRPETRMQLEEYEKSDARIRLIRNAENIGLTKSLNKLLQIAGGTYLARMDADDISRPERLEKQYEYMESHPGYAVIGSRFSITGRSGVWPSGWNDNMEIRRVHFLFYNDGICHPSAFFRKSFLDDHRIMYDPAVKKAQDYAMWVSITEAGGKIGLCPENLFTYRVHPGQISAAGFANQMHYEQMTIRRQLDRFDPDFSAEDRERFYHLYRGEITDGEQELLDFLKRLVSINRQKQIYAQAIFTAEIRRIWKIGALKQLKKKHRAKMLLMIPKLSGLGD